MTEIILASTSPTRKELLEKTGLVFRVEASNFDETECSAQNPEEFVKYLALGKAKAVAKQNPTEIVIGADTVIHHKNKIIGKPRDESDAKEILKSYCGLTHVVYSGVAVIQGQKELVDVDSARVKFRNLSDNEIEDYIRTQEPFGKAGAYTIQKKGAVLIEQINGDYHSIIGLPLFKLFGMLKEFGVKLLK